jgi:autotransporter-associated beta strand protein
VDTGELWIGAYGGGTYNLSGGILEIGGGALKANYGSTGGGSAFNLAGGTIKVIGSNLSTAVDAALIADSTSTLDTNGLDASWSGVLSGGGALRKRGAGTATLGGNNSYSGGTLVEEGVVRAAHAKALGDGNVQVLNEATLEVGAGIFLNLDPASDVILDANGEASYQKIFGASEAVANFGKITSAGTHETTAALLNGTLSGADSVRASFKEISLASNDEIRVSDVLSLDGLSGEVFVLQLSYDEELAVALFGSESAVRMGWLDGGEWVMAAEGPAYFGEYGQIYSGLDVGSYGIDTARNVVWAVLDHNSDFAVVPEPRAGLLIVLGLIPILRRSARHLWSSRRCSSP